jgi:hypothetical protein
MDDQIAFDGITSRSRAVKEEETSKMANIQYRRTHVNHVQDGCSQVLREAAEYFESEKIQMTTGDGIKEILTSTPLFNAYVEKLSEGMDAEEAFQFAQLLENTRTHILTESSISGIQQVSALSMPMIRKAWPKIGLKNAIPTEAVKAPQFAISYLVPYLVKKDGTKLELPKAMRDPATEDSVLFKGGIRLNQNFIPLPNDAAGVNMIGSTVGAVPGTDTIDPNFEISTATIMVVPVPAGPAVAVDVLTYDLKADVNGRIFGTVKGTEPGGGTATDTLSGAIDRETGVFSLTSIRGLVTQVKVTGVITDETNTHGDSITFDIKKKEVMIGTGAHINAGLPMEWLQDLMAVYSLDGAMKAVDIISNVQSQKVDKEILQFLDKSFVRNAQPYAGSFNVFPSAQYNGSPTEWRSEIRTVIDWFATKIKVDSAMHTGSFAIVGNALDLNLIPNVDWIFTSSQEERAGVDVNFNVGAYAGANRYTLVASDNVPYGKLRLIFVPGNPDLMTFKYYPYTFSVENGYRDPRTPNIPNIMVARRDRTEELTPFAAEITIVNNNGSLTRTFVG